MFLLSFFLHLILVEICARFFIRPTLEETMLGKCLILFSQKKRNENSLLKKLSLQEKRFYYISYFSANLSLGMLDIFSCFCCCLLTFIKTLIFVDNL